MSLGQIAGALDRTKISGIEAISVDNGATSRHVLAIALCVVPTGM